MTIGTTVMARPWFETHRPASSAPMSRSRSRRSSRQTRARWRSSATSSEVERVHLREGRLLPERAGEGEAEGGGDRDDRPDVEADHDQDRRPRPRAAAETPEKTLARHASDPIGIVVNAFTSSV